MMNTYMIVDRQPHVERANETRHGTDPNHSAYHLVQLVEAGLLDGSTKMASVGNIIIFKLTWKGHEFLDDIRDPEIWGKTKERAKTIAGVGFNFL
jgi:DNA-binding PadR family transcriptional regulator